MEKIKMLGKTKKGYPAFWECGGAGSNTGSAYLICDKNGDPKKPLFIKTGGHLSNSEHALFIPNIGDVVVYVSRHREDYQLSVWEITSFEPSENGEYFYMIGKSLTEFSDGEWTNDDVATKFKKVIETAKAKSRAYHCRTPYYFKEETK